MSRKPIGFLQEDFHSEVLDFLLELASKNYPNVPLILYNNNDIYNNKDLYKLKYPNLAVKELRYFIPDLANDFFYKCFVISYDNIINLTFLINYKSKLIFVAHSPKHINLFNQYNFDAFSLTSLLSDKYMLPILQECNPKIDDTNRLIKQLDTQILEDMKKRAELEDLTIIITVGYFQNDNKDLNLIHNLLNSKKILLLSFVPQVSEELNNLANKNIGYIFVACNLSTSEVQYCINYLNIKYLLFTPCQESKFYKDSWSGSVAFAINNNLNLIMPKMLSDYYHITSPNMITYDPSEIGNNIINTLQVRKFNNSTKNDDLQRLRDDIWNKNTEIFVKLLN